MITPNQAQLDTAAMYGEVSLAKNLLPKLSNACLETALYLAVDHYTEEKLPPRDKTLWRGGHNSLEIIQLFLDAGAAGTINIGAGKTALERAAEKSTQVVMLFTKSKL